VRETVASGALQVEGDAATRRFVKIFARPRTDATVSA